MKEIFVYLKNYVKDGNKKAFLYTSLIVASLVALNYTFGIERTLKTYDSPFLRVLGFFLLYAFVFAMAHGIQFLVSGKTVNDKNQFYFLLLLAPLLFAAKISLNLGDFLEDSEATNPWTKYWLIILNWPVKSVVILFAIAIAWRIGGYEKPVAGITARISWKPYILLLLCSLPLLAVASSMDQFHQAYPKVKNVAFISSYVANDLLCKILFELSYGSDFLTIESFFRGFVLLAFVRYVGRDAILPMAAFYCSIHFGKPLFECITSYFGGLILGAIVYQTRSIWGGLIVHLGMAWLMEVFAALTK